MNPVQDPFDPCSRFIGVHHPTAPQELFQVLHARLERSGSLSQPVCQRSFRQMAAEHVATEFLQALHRQQLKLRQVHCQGLHPWPILGRGIHSSWEMGRVHMLTDWTANGLHLVFNHTHAHFRQFIDLPTFTQVSGNRSQIMPADFTPFWSVGNHLIRLLHLQQRLPLMPRLSS